MASTRSLTATKKETNTKAAARVGKPGIQQPKRSAAPEKKLRQRLKQNWENLRCCKII